jgi:hypothetical protein
MNASVLSYDDKAYSNSISRCSLPRLLLGSLMDFRHGCACSGQSVLRYIHVIGGVDFTIGSGGFAFLISISKYAWNLKRR